MDKEEVSKILSDAWSAVDASGIPEELRESAFGRAITLLVGGRPQQHIPASLAIQPSVKAGADGAGGFDDESPLDRIASRLKVSRQAVDHVYNFRDGEIEIVVSSRLLPSAKAAATQILALLVAAARQSNGEDFTPTSIVRDVAERYKKLDSKNFATAISSMGKIVTQRGEKTKKEIRLAVPGWDRASEIVAELGGESKP